MPLGTRGPLGVYSLPSSLKSNVSLKAGLLRVYPSACHFAIVMLVGVRTFTDVVVQVPARPVVPPVRLKVASVRPVVPSGRVASSVEVNVWLSADTVHFDLVVTFPSSSLVDSQLLGPVVLMDQVSPYFVT